jgi:hypothetical protein
MRPRRVVAERVLSVLIVAVVVDVQERVPDLVLSVIVILRGASRHQWQRRRGWVACGGSLGVESGARSRLCGGRLAMRLRRWRCRDR